MSVQAPEAQDLKISCWKCSYTLGRTDRVELSFKKKDLYFYVRGGLVITPCWRCGAMNYCCDSGYKKTNPEEIARVRGIINIGEAVFTPWQRVWPSQVTQVKVEEV